MFLIYNPVKWFYQSKKDMSQIIRDNQLKIAAALVLTDT